MSRCDVSMGREPDLQIEITPAMIEAGVVALVDHEDASPAFQAEVVFLAMRKAQCAPRDRAACNVCDYQP